MREVVAVRRLLALLAALFIGCSFPALAEAVEYVENEWNYVDGSMDVSGGIPENAQGTLASIRDAGVLRVATNADYPPQEFIDPAQTGQAQYIGSDMELARAIAADGEGSTKLVTVDVMGAATEGDAETVARSIANSPLVKTCIAGHDANWGRVAAAAGKCGVPFEQTNVDIDFMGVPVCRKGLTVPMDEEDMLRRFEQPEISIAVNIGMGNASCRIWTCDLTHDYISINADYRS